MTSPVFGKVLPGVTYVERRGAYGISFNEKSQLAVVETPMGLFLPGGGVEPGESIESGLHREFLEEIGYQVLTAELFAEASQFHWSEFYKQHFKKVGSFFKVDAKPVLGAVAQKEHKLIWLAHADASRLLSQEFQRWAVLRVNAPLAEP